MLVKVNKKCVKIDIRNFNENRSNPLFRLHRYYISYIQIVHGNKPVMFYTNCCI